MAKRTVRSNIRGFIFSLATLALTATSGTGLAGASAYLLSEGQQQYTTGFTYLWGDHIWNRNSNLVRAGCTVQDYYWHHSYTHGSSYYYNIFAKTAFSHNTCGNQPSVSGLGDVELGVRGRLDKFRNGRTWELSVIAPTGYNKNRANRLGYGRFGIWGGLAFSTQNTGWEPRMPSYWEFGGGIKYWFGPPATQFVGYIKWSKRLGEDGSDRLIFQLKQKLSFRDHTAEFIPGNLAPRFPGDYDETIFVAKYSHYMENGWIIAPSFGKTLYGRNAVDAWYVDLSFTYTWD